MGGCRGGVEDGGGEGGRWRAADGQSEEAWDRQGAYLMRRLRSGSSERVRGSSRSEVEQFRSRAVVSEVSQRRGRSDRSQGEGGGDGERGNSYRMEGWRRVEWRVGGGTRAGGDGKEQAREERWGRGGGRREV